ncbi:MAG: glycosyltransferase family 9 protein [bacterium]|nr:glycosyltransferase family 9 protein [bacterium]
MKYKIVNRKKRIAVQTADILLRPLVRGWQKLTGKTPQPLLPQDFPKIKKILILRTAYTGDVVMTLPVLNPIRNAFPNAEIYFLTSHSAAPVLEEHPAVVQVIKYDAFWFYSQPKGTAFSNYRKIIRRLRQEEFEVVFDFRGDFRDIFFLAYRSRAKHRISYGIGGGAYWLTQVIPWRVLKPRVQFHLDILRELNIPVEDDTPKLYLTAAEKQNALTQLKSLGLNPEQDVLIGIHSGARMPLKRWTPDRYAELIELIRETNLGKVICFTEPEKGSLCFRRGDVIPAKVGTPIRRFVVLSDLTLRELAAVLSFCKVLVCNDSAPMHIAAAVGSRCVALFGPSKSGETAPAGIGHIVIEKEYPCREGCDEATCRYKIVQECMSSITVDEVYHAVEQAIRAK